ncbi:progesterone immunomodulatory binding factor 1, putative [Ichthyophthirius multifiliis]|uniref:Progesterone immunomodulatory binding factor 1, putative n=1 Tax=Ichthyophthirius multifiliis TaxID=5932 RepID=G0R071_ICHMU|nr:progesterone immunomodulatory binding factor 1, putative [Ichthyophthirius multifiliis]EGR29131.1 progesterone immunomodulatory binding factor 1, putative [Ichthyophthirius multifiliis]|eukprot:XP_004030367.1 progesterone immunomodulatory binding factor 1, putative [Ichthyophthirius multifiliis]
MLEKQNQYLNNEIQRQKVHFDHEKVTLANDFKRQEEALLNQIKQIKAKTIHVEGQIPLIKEALAQVRDMLSGLVPENVYLRLRDLPEKDLPTNEWILVNVWELLYPFKKENDLQKKEIQRLRDELRKNGDKQNQLLGELEHSTRMLNDKEEDHKRHLLNYENSRKALEMELLKMQEELDILREKGSAYDELNRKYKQIEQEKFLLEEKIGFYNADQDGKNLLSDVYKVTDDLRRKNELLIQDKDYLTKENIQLIEKNKRCEDRIDRLQKEYQEAKDQAAEYLFQLLNHRNTANVDFEKRIHKEIGELRERHAFELESTKNNLIDIYEKQLRFLKDTKEELEIKCESLQGQLREKQSSYESILIENRVLQKRVEADLGEIRIQLRLKSEEYERISNLYEENLAGMKALKLENEMLREKTNVLRAEYYKAENSAKENQAQIKAELAVCKEQLRNYESIEKEIDEAVMGLGSSNPYDEENVYIQTLNSAPTSNKRRIKQAISLAQRLQSKQKENEGLIKQIKCLKDDLEKTQDELRVAKDLIDRSSQPYSFVISQIEEKEKEIFSYKQALKKSDQDYQNIKEEYNLLKEQYYRVEGDVKKLLIRRENIQNIQSLLIKLAQADRENIQSNVKDVLIQIQEILSSKGNIDPVNYKLNGSGQKSHNNSFNNAVYQQQNNLVPQWAQKLKNTLKK